MAIHGIMGIITFFDAWFNVPANPIPTLEEQRLTAAYEMSKRATKEEDKTETTQESEVSVMDTTEEEIPSFLAVMFSWPCLLSLLTMCITQLRIVMYIGLCFIRSFTTLRIRRNFLNLVAIFHKNHVNFIEDCNLKTVNNLINT